VGVNRPASCASCFDLKTEVKPSVFALAPRANTSIASCSTSIGQAPDPLLALVLRRPIHRRDLEGAGDGKPADLARADVPELPPGLPVVKLDPARRRTRRRHPRRRSREGRPPGDRRRRRGHGGETSGARGRRGTREKDVTLAIARRLKARLAREPNMRAVLVRDGDTSCRSPIASPKSRGVRADSLVSIHADAWVRPDARARRYCPVGARRHLDAASMPRAAARTVRPDRGVNLGIKDPVSRARLLDLSLTATINDSLKLAGRCLSELAT